MRIRILYFAVCLLAAFNTNATVTQKLILKNGSELDGYISTQRPGQKITFTTERAVIIMPENEVRSYIDHEINIKDLPEAWKIWGEKNDAFVGLGDNRTLVLNDIVTKNGTINRVKILERGAKVKYLEMSPNQYSLSWDSIVAVRAVRRGKLALSGVNRVYELKSGMQYEGEFVEEIPGETLSLYRENNYVEVFETANVIKYSIKKINPNQSLFEQCELIDILQLSNGSVVTGIIIEQNYSGEYNSNYILIQLENGNTRSIELSKVVEFRKEPNKSYNPLFDILLRPGEVVLNREETKFVTPSENKEGVVLDENTVFHTIKYNHPTTRLVVEINLGSDMNSQSFRVVKLDKFNEKRSTGIFSSEEYSYYGFTYGSFVNGGIQPALVETSVNNTTKLIFNISDKGEYVVYHSQKKNAIPFRIK